MPAIGSNDSSGRAAARALTIAPGTANGCTVASAALVAAGIRRWWIRPRRLRRWRLRRREWQHPREPGQLMRVLVAEDDPGSARCSPRASRRPATWSTPSAGDDAIDQLQFYEYDVAVIDWRMPRVSGHRGGRPGRGSNQAHRHAHAHRRDTPTDRIEGLDAGADDYLGQAVRLRRAAGPGPRPATPPPRRGRADRSARGGLRSTRSAAR